MHTKLILLFLLAFLAGCGAGNRELTPSPVQTVATTETAEAKREEETVQNELVLMINEATIPVIWEENASVDELKALAGKLTLHIDMSMYGGWEQVGSLGCSISRNDIQMTALPGDIMLYSGDQIVLFYGENTWAYTKLGNITLPGEEVTGLLSCGAVSITLAVR